MKALAIKSIAAFLCTGAFNQALLADMNKDTAAIENLKGCYEVNFHFKEVESLKGDYQISSSEYHNHALEWVDFKEVAPLHYSMQHILKTPHGPLKHWREIWQYDKPHHHAYIGNQNWQQTDLQSNLWNQVVLQVDDSPRYSCAASFYHLEHNSTWHCKTPSPLPRREQGRAADYDFMNRENTLLINSDQAIHLQNNIKTIGTTTAPIPLAREFGQNTYKKVDDSRCSELKNWWSENEEVWSYVQDMWDHVYDHHQTVEMIERVEGKKLWQRIFPLVAEYKNRELTAEVIREYRHKIHDLFHLYIKH